MAFEKPALLDQSLAYLRQTKPEQSIHVVNKFGGGCLNGPRSFERVAELLMGGRSHIAVFSALKGVTDRLQEAGELAAQGKRGAAISAVAGIHNQFAGYFGLLAPPDAKEGYFTEGFLSNRKFLFFAKKLDAAAKLRLEPYVEMLIELNEMIEAIAKLRELCPSVRARLMAWGELATVHLVNAFLFSRGVRAELIWDLRGLIFAGDDFMNARIMPDSAAALRGRFSGEGIYLVPGFHGFGSDGKLRLLGRNSTDYVAAYIAAALNAPAVFNKDVPGVLLAEPGWVGKEAAALVAERMSYRELLELSSYGAQVLMPLVAPVAEAAGIEVSIRDFWNNEGKGTLVGFEESNDVFVTYERNVRLVNVYNGKVDGEVFDCLRETMLGSVKSSRHSEETFVLRAKDVEGLMRLLRERGVENVEIEWEDRALIGIVGAKRLRDTPGSFARIAGALGSAGVDMKVLSQNISVGFLPIVVKKNELEKGVRAIHEEFYGPAPTLAERGQTSLAFG